MSTYWSSLLHRSFLDPRLPPPSPGTHHHCPPTPFLPSFPNNLSHTISCLPSPAKILLATISVTYFIKHELYCLKILKCYALPVLFYHHCPARCSLDDLIHSHCFNIQGVAEDPGCLSPAQISVVSCGLPAHANRCLQCTTNTPLHRICSASPPVLFLLPSSLNGTNIYLVT